MASELRDPAALARATIGWTYAWLGATLLTGIASLYEIVAASEVDGATPMSWLESPPELATSDIIGGVTGILYLVALIGSGYLTLRWIYRTNTNAHVFSSEMTVTPGWAVGWFFVPVATLWKPYQGVRETWQASHGEPISAGAEVPGMLKLWWGLWLASNIAANVAVRVDHGSTTLDGAIVADYFDILSVLLSVPLAFALIALIKQLTSAQTIMAAKEPFA